MAIAELISYGNEKNDLKKKKLNDIESTSMQKGIKISKCTENCSKIKIDVSPMLFSSYLNCRLKLTDYINRY
jgi:hypothetical protein